VTFSFEKKQKVVRSKPFVGAPAVQEGQSIFAERIGDCLVCSSEDQIRTAVLSLRKIPELGRCDGFSYADLWNNIFCTRNKTWQMKESAGGPEGRGKLW